MFAIRLISVWMGLTGITFMGLSVHAFDVLVMSGSEHGMLIGLLAAVSCVAVGGLGAFGAVQLWRRHPSGRPAAIIYTLAFTGLLLASKFYRGKPGFLALVVPALALSKLLSDWADDSDTESV